MTTIAFTPTVTSVWQAQVTLDGQNYTLIVNWNLYGQRYYINITTLNGGLVVSEPLVGSPPNYDINLIGGYFTTSTMVFREDSQTFEITP